MEKIRLYYKSDFKLNISCDVGWQTPFILTFFTGNDRRRTYTASWNGTTFHACRLNPDNPNILEVGFDDHHLPCGTLMIEMHYMSSDSLMPSGIYDMYIEPRQVVNHTADLDQLVVLDYEGDNSVALMYELPMAEAELLRQENERKRIAQEEQRQRQEQTREEVLATSLAVFDEHDRQFQRNEESRTARFNTLTATFADWWNGVKDGWSSWYKTVTTDWLSFNTAAHTSEQQRITAETARINAERDRIAAEQHRQDVIATSLAAIDEHDTLYQRNEQTRNESEIQRTNAEKTRQSAETSRVNAETRRVTAFAQLEASIGSWFSGVKQDWITWLAATMASWKVFSDDATSAESARATAESARKTAETSRATAETQRAESETKRINAETTRQSNESTRNTNEQTRQSQEQHREDVTATALALMSEHDTIYQRNEQTRETNTQQAITLATAATSRANTAAEGAERVDVSNDGYYLIITRRDGSKVRVYVKGDKGDSVTMFPNVTIFGQPTIQESQISGFSAQNYLQFPFIVDFAGRPWQLDFSITTGSDLTQQHNVLDSAFGLALAISGGKFVLAMSTNGTSWDLGAVHGSHTLTAASTYYLRLTFDGSRYVLAYSTDKQTYTTDITVQSAASLAPKQIIIGKSLDDRYIFNGSINMSDAHLAISGKVVWDGMDDAGLATRMAIDMSNIDAAGRQRVNEIVIAGPVFEVMSAALASYDERILAIQQSTSQASDLATTAIRRADTAISDSQTVSNSVATAVTNLDERMSAIEHR